MTGRDLMQWAAERPWEIGAYFVLIPVLAWGLNRLAGKERAPLSPWKYFYSSLVHLSCAPGMLAAVLTGYAIFFTKQNLLDVNLLIYALPVASMVATLLVVSSTVSFDDIPGFDRLSGLMLTLAVTFVIILALEKTRIWVVFASSIWVLLITAAIMFLALRYAARLMIRGKDGSPR